MDVWRGMYEDIEYETRRYVSALAKEQKARGEKYDGQSSCEVMEGLPFYVQLSAAEATLQTVVICLKREFGLDINEKARSTPGIELREPEEKIGFFQKRLSENKVLNKYISEWRKEKEEADGLYD
jgi:hypothetical protein